MKEIKDEHDSSQFIGKTVPVVIDRPLGSKHPKFGFVYPVNYGYVPDTKAADGGGLDAYVLGIDEPLKMYEGQTVAMIHRLDDNDDKLIVTNGENFTDEEIKKLTNFQEQFFKSVILREPLDLLK
ncbi:MAG: inorganic diphosphatase [Christensenellaceae bacterium]|jgi:inorganic pyrophosphatase|nr:inorganic diphosphatase [Christensenellaceae bacterium]